MNTASAPGARWSLQHQWRGASDREALRHCREALEAAGILMLDAPVDEAGDAVKLHGAEITERLAARADALLDLRVVASSLQWAARVPRFMQRYASVGGPWFGIPMGIHRSNVAWVNESVARQVGVQMPASIGELLRWLDAARRHTHAAPLALTRKPNQIGALFESVVLAVAGASIYRQAFEGMQPSAWSSPPMLEALWAMAALRDHVDDALLADESADPIEHVRRADAALHVAGDWVRASLAGRELLEWSAPGTAGKFVAIMDFFVPLAGSDAHTAATVARVLTAPDFQLRFARTKGCMPAVHGAWAACDPLRMRLLGRDSAVLPSFTYDQCCAAGLRSELLAQVADTFVRRLDAKDCTRHLAQIAGRR